MIALREQLPLLRLGREEVVHYEESWLKEIIKDAAERSGCGDSWFADDIAKGIVLYLKERFPANSIGIEELFEKIARTLRAVGFDHVAGHLEPFAPPARLSLSRLAEAAGPGFELRFFQLLGERIEVLRSQGTRQVHCSELRDAVSQLCSTRRWSRKCQDLQDEILDYVTTELCRARGERENVSIMVS